MCGAAANMPILMAIGRNLHVVAAYGSKGIGKIPGVAGDGYRDIGGNVICNKELGIWKALHGLKCFFYYPATDLELGIRNLEGTSYFELLIQHLVSSLRFSSGFSVKNLLVFFTNVQ